MLGAAGPPSRGRWRSGGASRGRGPTGRRGRRRGRQRRGGGRRSARRSTPLSAEASSGERDVLRRRLIVLDWFFERFEAHNSPDNIIRYEELVESGGVAFFRRLGRPEVEPVVLESGNASSLDGRVNVDGLLEALLENARGLDPVVPPR